MQNLNGWKKFFVHLILMVMEKCFEYLHERFDIYYDLDNDCFDVMQKGESDEKYKF